MSYNTTRGQCSYCGRTHRKGKRNDSCRGHAIRTKASPAAVADTQSRKHKRPKPAVLCDKCGVRKVRYTTKAGRFCRKHAAA